ncbi:MAG: hypothetical protein NVS2B6_18190 [Thermoleophilaceae bacterium]
MIAVLALAGVRAIFRTVPPAPVRAIATHDLMAEAYAASFVREYLTWDAGDAEGHARRVSRFLPTSLRSGQDIVSPGLHAQRVHSTLVVQDRIARPRERALLVEAETTAGPINVALRIGRTPNGFLYLASYPSLVGALASTANVTLPTEQEISDPALEAVLRRAIGNYVESQASNLRADLTPDAVVALPPLRLTLGSIDRLTWARSGTAAVELSATGPDRTAWTLRYELSVVKRERWYVRSIAVNPALEESKP